MGNVDPVFYELCPMVFLWDFIVCLADDYYQFDCYLNKYWTGMFKENL